MRIRRRGREWAVGELCTVSRFVSLTFPFKVQKVWCAHQDFRLRMELISQWCKTGQIVHRAHIWDAFTREGRRSRRRRRSNKTIAPPGVKLEISSVCLDLITQASPSVKLFSGVGHKYYRSNRYLPIALTDPGKMRGHGTTSGSQLVSHVMCFYAISRMDPRNDWPVE